MPGKHVPVKHVPVRHMLGYVLKHVPGQVHQNRHPDPLCLDRIMISALRVGLPVLGHVVKHVFKHMLRHVLEYIPGYVLEHMPQQVLAR